MAEGMITHIASSNMSPGHKTRLMNWYENAKSQGLVGRVTHHARQTAESIRAGGEATIVGTLAGAIEAEIGLDIPAGGYEVPIDGSLGAFGLVMGAFVPPGEFVNRDAQNIGGDLWAIFCYRKTEAYLSARKAAGKGVAETVSKVAGEFTGGRVHGAPRIARGDVDDIVECAKNL